MRSALLVSLASTTSGQLNGTMASTALGDTPTCYGKPTGAQPLMLKSTGSYPMATKASGTLALIIEKQHASWVLTGAVLIKDCGEVSGGG